MISHLYLEPEEIMANPSSSVSRETVCLELLRGAKSDNEKLAGLLLVPKLFSTQTTSSESGGVEQSINNDKDQDQLTEKLKRSNLNGARNTLDKQFQKELLGAIDFTFLRRLLAGSDAGEAKSVSLSEDSVSLKSAALSVLLCFSEEGVLSDTQINQIISTIENILVTTSHKDNSDSADLVQLNSLCVQCLENFAKDQTNRVVEEVILPALYRLMMKQTRKGSVGQLLMSLVLNILGEKGTAWLSATSKIAVCALHLHYIAVSEPGDIDFDLCERTSRIVLEISDARIPIPPKMLTLIDGVMGQLCDALKSKLPSSRRQQSLKLLTALIQIRGIKELINGRGSKAALLVIHLCSIEVRMTLEQDDNERVVADSETLCSSFFALEQMIFYMAHEERSLALDGREIIQAHSALQGAVSAVVYFLTNCANEESVSRSLYGTIAACIRLLGAWTAEETESLLSKYTKVLPHLITICGGLLNDMDSFKFLVPGLSNFTTDTEAIVDVIVDNLEFMCRYVEHCCLQLKQNKEEYEHVLVNSCVVILNCLMLPDVKLNRQPVSHLLETLSAQTLEILPICNNLDCNITMIVCALTSLRTLYNQESGSSASGSSITAIESSSAGSDSSKPELESSKSEGASSQTEPLSTITETKYSTFYRQSIEYLLSISDSKKAGVMRSEDVPEIWLMGIQVLGELMKKSVLIKDLLIEEDNIRRALSLFDKHSSSVDVSFVLERLLLAVADKAGTKDLIIKINKAKKSHSK